jgi:uncharacterized protein
MARGGRGPIRRLRSRFPLLALTLSIPVLGLLGFVGYRFFHQENSVLRRPPEAATSQPRKVRARAPAATQKQFKAKRIVLIVDDVGYDDRRLRTLTSLDPKLNFAIIPGTPNARKSAEMLRLGGFEVLCHLPMEPLGYPGLSVGSGTILTSMSSAQIREQTRNSLRSVPFARGVNNHMGSRATTDRRVMTAVMSVLKEEHAYFVDSVTNADSIGTEVARKSGVRAASRNVFLDHELNAASIRHQIVRLSEIAEKDGIAIGIAHQHPLTIRILQREIPRLRARGFQFVSAAEAVN